jgi:hypothetical protein
MDFRNGDGIWGVGKPKVSPRRTGVGGLWFSLVKSWWPGTELNRRRQPFQFKDEHYLQQLTRLRETANYLQVRGRRPNYGLRSGLEIAWLCNSKCVANTGSKTSCKKDCSETGADDFASWPCCA